MMYLHFVSSLGAGNDFKMYHRMYVHRFYYLAGLIYVYCTYVGGKLPEIPTFSSLPPSFRFVQNAFFCSHMLITFVCMHTASTAVLCSYIICSWIVNAIHSLRYRIGTYGPSPHYVCMKARKMKGR